MTDDSVLTMSSDAWMALATVALAIGTIVLAVSAWRSAANAAASAASTERSALATEGLIDALATPVILPSYLGADTNSPERGPDFRLKNIGSGIAVEVTVLLLGPSMPFGEYGETVPYSQPVSIGTMPPGLEVPAQGLPDAAYDDEDRAGINIPVSIDASLMQETEIETTNESVWGAVEHHDEWSLQIDYRSLSGSHYRTTWEPFYHRWNFEVITNEA